MKMKRILSLLLTITIVFVLSACSGGRKGVSMEQIETDILNLETIEDYFYSEFTYYDYNKITIDDISIVKRQTNFDDKEDLVFCNVSLQDEYFNVTFTIEMKYIYYDEGGWILEDKGITDRTKTPISAPEELSVILASIGELDENKSKKLTSSTGLYAYYIENNKTREGKLKGYNIEVLSSNYNEVEQVLNLKIHTYNKFNDIYGTIILKYFEEVNDWGWFYADKSEPISKAYVKIDSIDSDFSSIIGATYLKYVNNVPEYDKLYIKEIDLQNCELKTENGTLYFNKIEVYAQNPLSLFGGLQYIESSDEWDHTGYKNVYYKRVK